MSMTKTEIKKKLDEAGIEYSNDATKSELKQMLDELNEKSENIDIDSNNIIEEQDSIEVEEKIEMESKVVIGRQATQVECMNQMLGKKPDGSKWGK